MVSDSALADVQAVVILDSLGRYAKDFNKIAEVRLYTGTGCDHISLTRAEFYALTRRQRIRLEQLPGRPECIDTSGKSNA